MDRSRRAGIGEWHEYDHVACNNKVLNREYALKETSLDSPIHRQHVVYKPLTLPP